MPVQNGAYLGMSYSNRHCLSEQGGKAGIGVASKSNPDDDSRGDCASLNVPKVACERSLGRFRDRECQREPWPSICTE